jgi:hypothetical protein
MSFVALLLIIGVIGIVIGLPCDPPCIAACPNCDICADDFGRANSSNISTGAPTGCAYTEDSGAWDITSGELRCTSPGNMHCNTAHPDGVGTMKVSVWFKHNTNNEYVDVLVGWVNTTTYFYARYAINGSSGSVTLYTAGGTPIGTGNRTINEDTWYTASVCVTDDGRIHASLNGEVVATAYGQTVTGTKCGLGMGVGGTAYFRHFRFSMSHATGGTATTCPECAHPPCLMDCDETAIVGCKLQMPVTLKLEIDSWDENAGDPWNIGLIGTYIGPDAFTGECPAQPLPGCDGLNGGGGIGQTLNIKNFREVDWNCRWCWNELPVTAECYTWPYAALINGSIGDVTDDCDSGMANGVYICARVVRGAGIFPTNDIEGDFYWEIGVHWAACSDTEISGSQMCRSSESWDLYYRTPALSVSECVIHTAVNNANAGLIYSTWRANTCDEHGGHVHYGANATYGIDSFPADFSHYCIPSAAMTLTVTSDTRDDFCTGPVCPFYCNDTQPCVQDGGAGGGTGPYDTEEDCNAACPQLWWCYANGPCIQDATGTGSVSGPYGSESECQADCPLAWWCWDDGTCSQDAYGSGAAGGPYASEALCDADCPIGGEWWCYEGTVCFQGGSTNNVNGPYGSFGACCAVCSETTPCGADPGNVCGVDCLPDGVGGWVWTARDDDCSLINTGLYCTCIGVYEGEDMYPGKPCGASEGGVCNDGHCQGDTAFGYCEPYYVIDCAYSGP